MAQTTARWLLLLFLLCPQEPLAKPGDSFDTIDDAVLDAFAYLIINHPDWKKYEYAGCIYREGNSYKASLPETLREPNPKVCAPPPAPTGTLLVGEYHNHTSKENFSRIDLDLSPKHFVPQFLLTPKGSIKRYTPSDGKIDVLRELKV